MRNFVIFVAFVIFTLTGAGCSCGSNPPSPGSSGSRGGSTATPCAADDALCVEETGIFAPGAPVMAASDDLKPPAPPTPTPAPKSSGGKTPSWWAQSKTIPVIGVVTSLIGGFGSIALYILLLLASWGVWSLLKLIPNFIMPVQRVLQLFAPLLAALAIGNLLGCTGAGLFLGLSCTFFTPLWAHGGHHGGDDDAAPAHPTTAWPFVPNWLRYLLGIVSFLIGTGLCF